MSSCSSSTKFPQSSICSGSTNNESNPAASNKQHHQPARPTLRIKTNNEVFRQESMAKPVSSSGPLRFQRHTLYITDSADPKIKRWAHYTIDLLLPMTLVHDSVWENPFAAFSFRFYPDGYEYSLSEALHPHWDEEKFGRLVREHRFDMPHQIEVVLGRDFFNLYPTVLLKISEGAFSISKLSGCPGIQCDKSKYVTLYMDYILDSDTQFGGIGLYQDAHGGQSIWKTVSPGFGPAYDTMGLMLIALNYAFERINTVYRSSKVTLVITPPGGIDIVWKFGKLTVERSEQIWHDLAKEWTGPLAILEYIKNFLEQRRHHATEMDVPELESVQFKIPDTDDDAKRAVLSVNRLARLGASGQLCHEYSDTVDPVDEFYSAFSISEDCLYRYRKVLVAETMEELQYLAPWSMRVSSTQENHSEDNPKKRETSVSNPHEQQVSKTHDTKPPNGLNNTHPTTWLQMTASPLFGASKDEPSHLNLQSFKQDVLREVGRMVARNRQDMVEQEERFTMQQSTHLALIQEATTESLSLIKAQRLETQGQIPASLGRQSRIPSELKAENIRPTPLSSRQSSAQTTKYYGGGYPNPAAAPISNPAVSRNISAYSSQQQSLRGVPAILHDLLPQSPPHKDIKQNMNLPSDSNGMVSIPAMELQRLLNNAQLLTALADTVHELSIKDANQQQNQGTGPETEYRTTQDMELTTLRVSDGVHVHHQQMKRQWSYPPIQAEMGNERGAWHWF